MLPTFPNTYKKRIILERTILFPYQIGQLGFDVFKKGYTQKSPLIYGEYTTC